MVRETIAEGVVELQHVDGGNNVSDIATKPLEKGAFMELLDRLLMGFKT